MSENILTISMAISGLIAATGLALDKLTLHHQNSRLQNRLVRIWLAVDAMRVQDLAFAMATKFIVYEQKLFGSRLSVTWMIRVALFSIALTSLTIIGGRAIAILAIDTLNPESNNVNVLTSLELGFNWFFYNVNHLLIYPANILFDQLTLFATVSLLTLYVEAEDVPRRYILILCDIFIAFLLFNVFYFVAQQLDSTASMKDHSYLPIVTIIGDIGDLGFLWLHVHLASLCFVATVVIPTLLYLLMMFFAMIAKSSVDLGRFILLQFTELGATSEKTIFFYTGIFFGLLVSILGVGLELLSMFPL